MKLTDYLLLRIVPPLGAGLIRLVKMTMRIETVSRPRWEESEREGEGVIFAFWHNRLLLMPYAARDRKVAVLISQHRDGELISRTMTRFGFSSVRGSSSRGGEMALRKMPRLLKEGYDVAITPDGPRGPRYRVQSGVISLARLSGRPVYPVTFAAERFRSFSSWDRFQVPRLFSRGVFVWGEPVRVRRGDDLEGKRMELEAILTDITARADDWFSRDSRMTEQPEPIVER
jgi:lysophospholipid acyltransferase (LPLAT)-like uncharacterized protein